MNSIGSNSAKSTPLAAASMHPASSSEHCRCRAGDEEIARSVGVGGSTANRTKRCFVDGNLARALSEQPRPGAERKRMGKEEALLVATACASPEGPCPLDAQAAGRCDKGVSGNQGCGSQSCLSP